jgi:phosphonate transport system substrate-binding protein
VIRFPRILLSVLLGLALISTPARAAPSSLEIGVFPYLSTRTVLTIHQPLRQYLEKAYGRPVQLYTAPDFKTFVERTQRGDYDIVVTAPHFARLAQTGAGYTPLAMYTRELRGLVVVAKESPYKDIGELRGKTVAIPNRLAIVTSMSLQLLHDRGLEPGSDFKLLAAASHNSGVLSVQRGESQAAIVSVTALQQMPDELKDSMRVLATTDQVPHVMYLAHPRLGAAETERIRTALLHFAESPEGRAFLQANGFEGIRPVDDADLKRMDPYVKELRQMLGQAQ